MRVSLVTALAGSLLAACSGAADPSSSASALPSQPASTEASPALTPAPSVAIPDGWEMVSVDEEGFSLALPDGWLTVSAEDLAATGVFDQMIEDNPEAAAVMDQARQAIEGGQMSLMAFETGARTVETGFAANVNVVTVPDDGGYSAEEIAAQIKISLPLQIPGLEVLETDTTVLPAGEAAVVRSRWTLQTGQQELPLSLTQYAILIDGKGHILSFTVPDEHAADYAEIWAGVAESFRLD